MKVMHTDNLKTMPDPLGLFFGKVERQNLVERGAGGLVVAMVKFEAGAGNRMHAHSGEQVLVITEGRGVVATEKEEHIVTPGIIVHIPANEMHWHGATKDSGFAHLSIQTPGDTRLKA